MEAQVWMTGRVGAEVEVRESASPWSTFRLACTPRVVRAGEWGDEQTTWVTVSCSHRLAEHVRLSLHKGDPVIVVGKLRTRRWIDANGLEHEQLQIRASSVGHDLSVGASSFYRLRRETPAEAAAGEGATDAGEAVEEEFGGQEFDEDTAAGFAAVPESPEVAEALAGAGPVDEVEPDAEPAEAILDPDPEVPERSAKAGRQRVA